MTRKPCKVLQYHIVRPDPKTLCVPDTVEAFLEDATIGPLTGLTKLMADYELHPHASKPEFEPVRGKLYAGLLLCYLVTEKPHLIDTLTQQAGNPLTREDELLLQQGLTATSVQNRFETLLFDPEETRKQELNLRRDWRTLNRWDNPRYQNSTNQKVQEILETRPAQIYSIGRQLLGIELAQGRIQRAMRTLSALETVARKNHLDIDEHTKAVSTYLRNGGETHLRIRGMMPQYFWKKMIGSKTDPGRARELFIDCRNELIVAGIVGGILLNGAGFVAKHLDSQYHLLDRLETSISEYLPNASTKE